MPSVAQAPLMNSVSFMLKETSVEPVVSAFTAVNGRTSPPSPRRTNGVNGMSAETIHVRPLSHNRADETQDRKGTLPGREDWPSVPRAAETGVSNGHHSTSPQSVDRRTRSPESPGKRKRSSSAEDEFSSTQSPDSTSFQPRRRLDSYVGVSRDDSPQTTSQTQTSGMEHSQQRPFPPMDRADHDRNWPPRDSKEFVRATYESQPRDPRRMESQQDSMSTSPTDDPQMMGATDSQNPGERSSTTEITRAGVQVDPKKRKRQFANRTKTGCGTCRRRKKKCDEGKPECNNCTRGGFICEGYANKIPWPKNGISKPHVPLQAKDRFPIESAQLYHSHGQSREGYQESTPQGASDGARSRPIVVEEHDRQGSRNGWGAGWGEPPRPSYPPEHPPPVEYAHARPQSNDHQVEHPSQTPSASRQHNPRIYHHTQETMNPYGNKNPSVPGQLLQHQPQPSHQHPIHSASPAGPTGPPGPPPGHYVQQPPPPPKPQKTEKEKMLNGEPYLLFHPSLIEEREQCKTALYRFNSSGGNPNLGISREERERLLRAIVEIPWARHSRAPDKVSGHLGNEVFVDTPFTCDYGYNVRLGDHVVISPHCRLMDSRKITVGARTMIGENVTIQTKTADTDPRKRNGSRGTVYAAEVTIGEDVLIGCDVTILPGVKVGKGSTIAAGSVVTRDVPNYVLVAGNPAVTKRGIWKGN